MNVTNAEFWRIGLSGHKQFGEVSVTVQEMDDPLVAVFEKLEDGQLRLRSVAQNHEDRTLDWYDNPMHQAQVDVTGTMFGGADDDVAWTGKERFAQQVLAFGDVRHLLEMNLD